MPDNNIDDTLTLEDNDGKVKSIRFETYTDTGVNNSTIIKNSKFVTDEYEVNNNYIQETQKEFNASGTEANNELRTLLRANGIFRHNEMKYNETCYRFPRLDPYNFIDGAKEYIFITKVDLPLLKGHGNELENNVSQWGFFRDLWNSPGYHKSIFQNLCYGSYDGGEIDQGENNYPFMRILSNRKISNLDLPDISVEEIETNVNLFGSKLIYPKSSSLSDENIDFSLEFEDTRYCEIYNLFKAYDLYRQGKWLGLFGPGIHIIDDDPLNNDNNPVIKKYVNYIANKILYDHMSIYKFLVASDGETILYGAKITGCFPKTISRSSFSEIDEKGGVKITIGFKNSGWIEDGNLAEISKDFNAIMYNYAEGEIGPGYAVPIYDNEIDRVSQEVVDYPFIVKVDPKESQELLRGRVEPFNYVRYYLLWGNKYHKDFNSFFNRK